MRMTPLTLIVGGLLIFWSSTIAMVFIPMAMIDPEPSEIWRPMTAGEQQGYRLYVQNGCSYCHTQFIRVTDWGLGAERVAEAGDYVGREPVLFGTERTGPDLSQEGGEHPDDWHLAHFVNPRFTSPYSVMPAWAFLGSEKIRLLTEFVQFEGMLLADERMERQRVYKSQAVAAYAEGIEANIAWLHDNIPDVWKRMPNPYPASDAALLRGKKIYQQFCIGCHGPIGDGRGSAAAYLDPPPLNFTALRRNLIEDVYIGGILYYQVMNGVTGTAMPYFKKALESAKIWDVSNYVAVNFIGYTDADIAPEGIDAAYEPLWKNTYKPPKREAQP